MTEVTEQNNITFYEAQQFDIKNHGVSGYFWRQAYNNPKHGDTIINNGYAYLAINVGTYTFDMIYISDMKDISDMIDISDIV